MPSLIGNYVANNYRQQIVPFSRFGTRKVAWFKVGFAHTGADDVIDMENVNTIISAIQTQAEIVMIGAPTIRENYGKFMVCVFEDTMNNGSDTDLDGLADNNGPGYNGNSLTLQEVVRNATQDWNLEITRYFLFGAPGDNYAWDGGFNTNDDYREYDTKAQFVENSYTNPPADPSNP